MNIRYLEQIPAVIEYFCESASPTPNTIQLEVTNRCNLSCLFCPLTTLKRHRPFKSRDMTVADIAAQKSLFESADSVELTGFGDLFAHPDPIGILTALRNYNLSIRATTNGLLLTPEISTQVVQDNLLDVVTFSIDAADAPTYEAIRQGNWDRLLANLDALGETKKSQGKNRPEIWFSFLAMRKNIFQLPDFVTLASRYGVQKVIVQHLTENEHFEDQNCFRDPEQLAKSIDLAKEKAEAENVSLDVRNLDPSVSLATPVHGELFKMPAEFKSANRLVKTCPFPWEHTFIQADGTVSACAMVWELLDMGNLHTDSFDSIWQGETYRNLRRSMRSADPPDACVYCNYFGWRKPKKIDSLQSKLKLSDTDNATLGIGWHPPDKDNRGKSGRWTKKNSGIFLKNNCGRLLSIDAITHKGAPYLSGMISVHPIYTDPELPASDPIDFRFDSNDLWGLPLVLALPDIPQEILKIEIRLDHTWNPLDKIAQGYRDIGLFVYSIKLEKQKDQVLSIIEPEDHTAQLAQGWLPVEKVNGLSLRWIGNRATALIAKSTSQFEIEARCPKGLSQRTVNVLIDGQSIGANRLEPDGKVHLLRFDTAGPSGKTSALEILCEPTTKAPGDVGDHPRLFGLQVGKIAFR